MSEVLPEIIDLQGKKVEKLSGSGPSAPVTIAGNTSGDITITITAPGWVVELLSINSITGVPSGLAIQGFTYSKTPNTITITLTLYNATASGIPVGVNAISVSIYALLI
jgi:hypothetical protein